MGANFFGDAGTKAAVARLMKGLSRPCVRNYILFICDLYLGAYTVYQEIFATFHTH